MGKRQLGQMQPFELVLTLIIADLATIPMGEFTVPVLHGIIPLLTLVSLHYFLTVLTRKSEVLSKIVSGKPVIVINPNGIDYQSLKKLNISIDDLFEAIRGCGYFSLDEVQYAIVETNGTVNVLTKKDYSTLTIGDLTNSSDSRGNLNLENLKGIDESTIPVTLISEGSINKNNLKEANINQETLNNIIKKTDAKNVKDILILTLDGNGKVYFQTKKGNFKILNVDYKKEIA
jgi:uncharacterized membrane protein YcaP (DUF421 family)